MKHLFIVNPKAGGKDASEEIRMRVREAFRKRGLPEESCEIYITKAARDATGKILADAECVDELRVYACGGDGTFNECVNGAALKENVAVCPLPTGTGNDFCRMFGDNAERFRDLEALLDGEIYPIDLICCNGHYSANICSVGIDARIGTSVHDYSHLPFGKGPGAYVISAVVNALHGIATDMHIRCGDYEEEGKHSLVCVCNGRYYGGGFHPSLAAKLDDGDLDIYIARKVSLLTFARLIGKYAKGLSDQLPKYVTHLHGTEIQIDFAREDVINLDGEALRARSVSMRLIPKAMNLIVPAGMKADVLSALD